MSKILLVEDSADIMDLNASMLSLSGYEVLCAGNLKQASELLKIHEPDMIVLDILLPDGNGISWYKKLKEHRSIPVLFLSALNENEDIVAGLKAGGDDYLTKPYGLSVLLARVELGLKKRKKAKGLFPLENSSWTFTPVLLHSEIKTSLSVKKNFCCCFFLPGKAGREKQSPKKSFLKRYGDFLPVRTKTLFIRQSQG